MSDLMSRDREEVKLTLPNPLVRRMGMFRSAYDRLILAWNLFRDERVGWPEKAIPILTIAYLISPIDILPGIIAGPLALVDDLTVLILGLNWFIQAAPAEVVREYMDRLEITT
jgi:uncharacterized membrane protein YkvA (DUF1232 family)